MNASQQIGQAAANDWSDAVFHTANTVYYVKRAVCVAARDRASGRWLGGSHLIGAKFKGFIEITSGPVVRSRPDCNSRLWFVQGRRDVITTVIRAIEILRQS